MLVALVICLPPVGVHVSQTGVNLGRSNAYADGSTGAPPLPEGAKEAAFISLMADEAGLSESDYVAASVGIIEAVTGVVMARNPGIRLADATLGENLDYLIDAADYPAWEDLSASEQESYGNNQLNYNSSKYMSLMAAFGLDKECKRYKEFDSSGGGHFLLESESADRIRRIGKVGQLWTSKLGVAFGDLQSLITDITAINRYFGTTPDSVGIYFDGSDIDGWPESISKQLQLNYGSSYNYYVARQNETGKKYGTIQTSRPVYMLLLMDPDGTTNGFWPGYMAFFDGENFTWGKATNTSQYPNVNMSTNPSLKTYNEKSYYASLSSGSVLSRYQGGVYESSFVYNEISYSNGPSFQDFEKVVGIIATNSQDIEEGTGGELEPDVSGYPTEEIPSNTDVYFPEQGLNPSNTWNNFTNVQRPVNNYNPGDETSTPEWKQETKQNVQGLSGIKFDELFPFSMLYDIPKLFEKVEGLTGTETEGGVYNRVSIPLHWSQNGDANLVVELDWLYTLLVMIRPFNQILLGAGLFAACLMFWRSILTG